MNSSNLVEIAAFGAFVARCAPTAPPSVIGEAVVKLAKASRMAALAALRECNGHPAREASERRGCGNAELEKLDDYNTLHVADQRKKARKLVAFAAAALGVPVDSFTIHGDPRGACLTWTPAPGRSEVGVPAWVS